MAVSPLNLRDALLRPYRPRNRACAAQGEPAKIWLKMNALVDPEIIDALYEASRPA